MKQRNTGFTLLELMVVMVLIGVLLALVVPAMNSGPAQQARQHGHELLGLLHVLRERAVAEGRDYGLRVEAGGYQWMARTAEGWRPQRAYPLPDGLHFRLEVDGQASVLTNRTYAPQVLILSSDELSAFSLHYDSADGRWLSISSDGVNDAAIHEG